MDIKVSVIVPVYNVGRYLHKCVRSLLDQTYKNVEISWSTMSLQTVVRRFVMNLAQVILES